MRDVGAKIPSHDTVPSWIVFLIELLLDESGNILLFSYNYALES
jgi:hypothetical protein